MLALQMVSTSLGLTLVKDLSQGQRGRPCPTSPQDITVWESGQETDNGTSATPHLPVPCLGLQSWIQCTSSPVAALLTGCHSCADLRVRDGWLRASVLWQ